MKNLILLIFMGLIVGIASSQSDTIHLNGVVNDKFDTPIPFVGINIWEGKNLIQQATADIDGLFNIQFESSEDTFQVIISSTGFPDGKKTMRKDTLHDKRYVFHPYTAVSLTPTQLEQIYQDAYVYIKKDKAVILTDNWQIKNNKFQKKYGFKYRQIIIENNYDGCFVTEINPYQLAYMNAFNKFIYEHLENRNGIGWQERYEKDYKDYLEYLKVRDKYWITQKN